MESESALTVDKKSSERRKNKGGRPPKPEAEKRKKRAVYLSDREHRKIRAKAEKSDLGFSAFMRYAALGKEAASTGEVPKEVLELKGELERIGVNINQLAKRAHTDGYGRSQDALEATLERQLIPTLKKLDEAYR